MVTSRPRQQGERESAAATRVFERANLEEEVVGDRASGAADGHADGLGPLGGEAALVLQERQRVWRFGGSAPRRQFQGHAARAAWAAALGPAERSTAAAARCSASWVRAAWAIRQKTRARGAARAHAPRGHRSRSAVVCRTRTELASYLICHTAVFSAAAGSADTAARTATAERCERRGALAASENPLREALPPAWRHAARQDAAQTCEAQRRRPPGARSRRAVHSHQQ